MLEFLQAQGTANLSSLFPIINLMKHRPAVCDDVFLHGLLPQSPSAPVPVLCIVPALYCSLTSNQTQRWLVEMRWKQF